MPIVVFTLSNEEKSDAVERLIAKSSPRQEYFLMIILAIAMATFGLLIGNVVVIIGSMLVAPLLSPILSFALGIVMLDPHLILRSSYTIFKSVVYSLIAAAFITVFFVNKELSNEIISHVAPSLVYASIAIVAGLAAAFASIRPNLAETLPGVAISVSLIPPLAVSGIGITRLDWNMVSGAILLFLVNILGIVFASMLVFSLSHFYVKWRVAAEAVKKDEADIKKEEKQAEAASQAKPAE